MLLWLVRKTCVLAALMVTAFVWLGADSLAGGEIQEYGYEPAIYVLNGRLVKKLYYGPPGFGEDPDEDSRHEVSVLVLEVPISLVSPGENSDVQMVRRIQLAGKNDFQDYWNECVVVEGSFFHRSSPYHFLDTLMAVSKISPCEEPGSPGSVE